MKHFILSSIILLGTLSLTACLSDGDETISLEYDDGTGGGSDNGGKGKLVSGITVTTSSRASSEYQTIKFFYDSSNRVKAVEYGGNDQIVLGPQGCHMEYKINGSTMTLYGWRLGQEAYAETSPGKGKLNSQGYLEMEYFEAGASEIQANDYLICYYEHNSKNQVTKMRVVESDKPNRDFHVCNYTWTDDCMVNVTGNPGGAGYGTFRYSTIENKANINLNRMIYDQMFSEDIFGLALCGYISAKEKYLVEGNWNLDNSGYPVSITIGGYTYSISYTE